MKDLEPMFSEKHAADALGIMPRSLRTERENGNIAFKKVAGVTPTQFRSDMSDCA